MASTNWCRVIAAVMTIEDDIAFLERVPILRRLAAGALRILVD